MKVLAGPGVDLEGGGVEVAAARALAGPGGTVLSLRDVGVSNFSRPLSAAEVALLREAMTNGGPADGAGSRRGEKRLLGYVCGGTWSGEADAGQGAHRPRLVIVTDHANLTWRSPLTGPNDDSVGPRFPSMTGIYAPEVVIDRLGAAEGMIVVSGVVAGVHDDRRLSAFEAGVAGAQGYPAVSTELVPVVIVAAHLGLRVAAVVVTEGSSGKGVR